MHFTFKTVSFWLAIVVASVAIYQLSNLSSDQQLRFDEFLTKISETKVVQVTFAGNKITGTLSGSPPQIFQTYTPAGYETQQLVDQLLLQNVKVDAVDVSVTPWAVMLWAPIALLIGFGIGRATASGAKWTSKPPRPSAVRKA